MALLRKTDPEATFSPLGSGGELVINGPAARSTYMPRHKQGGRRQPANNSNRSVSEWEMGESWEKKGVQKAGREQPVFQGVVSCHPPTPADTHTHQHTHPEDMLAVIELEATSWTSVACCCFCVSRGLCVHAVSKRGEAKDKPAARLEKHFS